MKRLLLSVLIWLLVVPTAAQDIEVWESACSDDAARVIAPLMGEDLYAAGCQALDLCSVENAPIGCEFPVYDALFSLCDGDDCALQSSFYMASLLIFEEPPPSMYAYIPDDIQPIIADTLRAFQAGDYQQVITIYENVAANLEWEIGRSAFLDYIIGLMHEHLGDLEAADTYYRTSIELVRMPFVTAQRANLLIQLGHPDAAAAEALVMGDYPAAEAILAEHPLPDDLLQAWSLYRVVLNWRGEYGPSTTDFAITPALPFQMALLSDGSLLLIGAPEIARVHYSERIPPDILLFYPDGDAYVRYEHWSGLTINLSFEEQVGVILSHQIYVTGDIYVDMLIAPADVADPRAGQDQRCEGGAQWRLTVDGYGAATSVRGDEGTRYYDQPDGEFVGAFNIDMQTFRVVSGPLCINSQAWWEVELEQDDGLTYWLPEAEAQNPEAPRGLGYLVVPIDEPGE